MPTITRIPSAALLSCGALALGGGSAVGSPLDLRAPDRVDAAPVTKVAKAVDLRAPDRVDPAPATKVTKASQDLVSPDARDAATFAQGPGSIPIVRVPVVESQPRFDWGDAGIGAAGMVALVALGAGSVLLVGSRRRRMRVAAWS